MNGRWIFLFCLIPCVAVAETALVKCRERLLDIGSDPDAQHWTGMSMKWWDGTAGARPVVAPKTVCVEMDFATNGYAVLTLLENKSRQPATFAFTSRWERVMRFVTDMPDGVECRFEELRFLPESSLLRVNGRVLSAVAESARTHAGACEVDVDTGRDFRLLYDGDPAPALTLTNVSDRELAWTGEALLEDAFGHQVKVPIDIGAMSGETMRVSIPSPLPARGWWRVTTTVCGVDGSKAVSQTSLAWIRRHDVTPPLPRGRFRMGVQWHNGRLTASQRERTLNAVVACGAKLVRTSVGRRRGVENMDGTCDWQRDDEIVAALRSRGLAIDAGVWGNPDWAAFTNLSMVCREPDHPLIKGDASRIRMLCRPQDMKRCEEFYAKLGEHYGEEIAYYEIGNEWDLYNFYPGTTEDGIEILKACYRGLKRGNPKCVVMPCGWALPDAGGHDHRLAARFVNYAIQDRILTEARGSYDVHAVHLHGGYTGFRECVLGKLLPNRRRLGVTEPWFANETASSCVWGNEVETAKDVWKKIVFAWANGSVDYVWYNLRATSWEKTDSEQGYGIVTPDFKPRPAYAAFSALTMLEGLDVDSTLCSEAEGREIFKFRDSSHHSRGQVLVGWHNERMFEGCCRILTDALSAIAVDMMGNRQELEIEGEWVRWPISHFPGALILKCATRAELESDGAKTVVPTIALTTDASTERTPDLVADQVFQVKCPYDANPATASRTWQGPEDCSFKAWLSKTPGGLHLTVKVRDDKVVASETSSGDCLKVRAMVDGKVRESMFPSALGHFENDVLTYDVMLPRPIPETIVLQVEDDDGDGFDLSVETDNVFLLQ